jgi:hypothetical protein
MRKKFAVVVLIFFSLFKTNAQFTLTLQVPPSGVLLKSQLWNGIITSSYSDTKQLALGLTLTDAYTGEPVLTATTVQFGMTAGALQISESNLSPISYEYASPRTTDRNPNGYLPAGNFTACYTVFEIEENSGTSVVEQCIQVVVEPVSPPILNTPPNQDVLQTPNPQFTWLPPTPLQIFLDLKYDFILVEVLQGQTAEDAIQQNLPVYAVTQNESYLNYPSSGSTLDTGKAYAWKVIAKNGDSYAAESEVWEFKIGGDSIAPPVASDELPYVKLQKKLDATISDCEQILKFSYLNTIEDDTAISYSISSLEEDNLSEIIKQGILPVHYGQNYISVPLMQDNNFIEGRRYILTIVNSSNELWKLKFEYHNAETNNN